MIYKSYLIILHLLCFPWQVILFKTNRIAVHLIHYTVYLILKDNLISYPGVGNSIELCMGIDGSHWQLTGI